MHELRRRILLNLIRITDLLVMTAAFVVAFLIAGQSLGSGSMNEFLAVRIKLLNILFFVGWLMAWHFILKSFGFHEVKHKGNWLMYMDLETVSFERFTSALQFSNSDTYLNEVCWRRGLTSPTQNKTFANGCL